MTQLTLKYINGKRIMACLLAFFILFYVASPLNALTTTNQTSSAATTLAGQITEITAPRGALALDLSVSGRIPSANIPNNRNLSDELNAIFMANHNAFIQAHATSALSFTFSVDIITFGEFVSVVQRSSAISASRSHGISSTVISATDMEIITLNDLGVNIISLIDNQIQDIIAENPRDFISNFTGIDSDHPFFIEDGYIVVPFPSAALHTANRNIFEVRLYKRAIQVEVLSDNHFMVLPAAQYSMVMLDLAQTVRLFGYEMQMTVLNRQATVLRNNRRIATFRAGQNRYTVFGSTFASSITMDLEIAPIFRDGRVFVPVSFFREVLGISVAINQLPPLALAPALTPSTPAAPRHQVILSIYNN